MDTVSNALVTETVAEVTVPGVFTIRGPSDRSPLVEAWCLEHIRFDHEPGWQEQLRRELRGRLRRLSSAQGEILGPTRAADVPFAVEIRISAPRG
jgi:hypothetical protein